MKTIITIITWLVIISCIVVGCIWCADIVDSQSTVIDYYGESVVIEKR